MATCPIHNMTDDKSVSLFGTITGGGSLTTGRRGRQPYVFHHFFSEELHEIEKNLVRQ